MLLQQTFAYSAGWDEHGYPVDESDVYGEELPMEVNNGSSSVDEKGPVAEEEEHDSDSDTYN
jgi:hypothetical protein